MGAEPNGYSDTTSNTETLTVQGEGNLYMAPASNTVDKARALLEQRRDELNAELRQIESAISGLGGGKRGPGRPRGSGGGHPPPQAPRRHQGRPGREADHREPGDQRLRARQEDEAEGAELPLPGASRTWRRKGGSARRGAATAPGSSLTPRPPGSPRSSQGPQGARQLLAGADVELLVGVAQVRLDGAHRDEQGLGDLLVGEAVGRHSGHPQLARGQRLQAAADQLARPGAAGLEQLVGALGERGRAAAAGQGQRSVERLASGLSVP